MGEGGIHRLHAIVPLKMEWHQDEYEPVGTVVEFNDRSWKIVHIERSEITNGWRIIVEIVTE